VVVGTAGVMGIVTVAGAATEDTTKDTTVIVALGTVTSTARGIIVIGTAKITVMVMYSVDAGVEGVATLHPVMTRYSQKLRPQLRRCSQCWQQPLLGLLSRPRF
jgi:uncharacterized membrane protein YfbV (UPF0208 family)